MSRACTCLGVWLTVRLDGVPAPDDAVPCFWMVRRVTSPLLVLCKTATEVWTLETTFLRLDLDPLPMAGDMSVETCTGHWKCSRLH